MPVAPHVKAGDPIRAVDFNAISESAGAMFRGAGGPGANVSVTPAGITISAGDQSVEFGEPATLAMVQNIGATDIEPFEPMSLTLPFVVQRATWPPPYNGNPIDLWASGRVLQGYRSTEHFFGRFGVASVEIPAGRAGMVWIAGVCLCKVARYFGAFDPSLLRWPDRADTVAGQSYLQASECGAAEVLWIYNTFSRAPVAEAPNPAIIRLAARNTTGVGVFLRGNDQIRGVAEVLHWEDMDVAEPFPGVVKLT